jgi:hypothetical protein
LLSLLGLGAQLLCMEILENESGCLFLNTNWHTHCTYQNAPQTYQEEAWDMSNRQLQFANAPALLLAATAVLCFGAPARAQTAAVQNDLSVQTTETNRSEFARFDRFLDSHPEIAEQVRRNPSLVDNREFVQNHPALQTYLQDNPGVRNQLRQDPNAFMQREGRFERTDNGPDRDAMRRDMGQFNHFLDSHREIAEQVRRNPSLVDNREFVQNHPSLQTYLQNNPGVRDQLRQDPTLAMRQENRISLTPDNRDAAHLHMATFGEFLQHHSDIATDVSRDPSLVKNHEYVDNHPELSGYLKAHPDVRSEWTANPQGFVKGAQQFRNGTSPWSTGNPNPVPKPKQ